MADEVEFGVVIWWPDQAESLAAPGDKARLLEHDVNGRVCRILGQDGPFKLIKCGGATFRISPEQIRAASNVKFEVGDKVRYEGEAGEVTDVVWHWVKAEPYYLLPFPDRKSSRRYFGNELVAEPVGA
jgi:hypothetical protein